MVWNHDIISAWLKSSYICKSYHVLCINRLQIPYNIFDQKCLNYINTSFHYILPNHFPSISKRECMNMGFLNREKGMGEYRNYNYNKNIKINRKWICKEIFTSLSKMMWLNSFVVPLTVDIVAHILVTLALIFQYFLNFSRLSIWSNIMPSNSANYINNALINNILNFICRIVGRF